MPADQPYPELPLNADNLDTAYRLIQHISHRFEIKAGIIKKLRGISEGGKPVEHLHFDTFTSDADDSRGGHRGTG